MPAPAPFLFFKVLRLLKKKLNGSCSSSGEIMRLRALRLPSPGWYRTMNSPNSRAVIVTFETGDSGYRTYYICNDGHQMWLRYGKSWDAKLKSVEMDFTGSLETCFDEHASKMKDV